ncbi:MAG: hypothetical protein M3072_14425 [Candidatus Dormibacteraeota bacterium]|nr:hypothetical protein [Candidatus Dormibacteraeota bacterium]
MAEGLRDRRPSLAPLVELTCGIDLVRRVPQGLDHPSAMVAADTDAVAFGLVGVIAPGVAPPQAAFRVIGRY